MYDPLSPLDFRLSYILNFFNSHLDGDQRLPSGGSQRRFSLPCFARRACGLLGMSTRDAKVSLGDY